MESPRVARATRLAAMLLCVAALFACSNDNMSSGGGSGGGTADERRLQDSLIVSGPLAPSLSVVKPNIMRRRMSASRIAADSIDNQVSYVSLPPGSFNGADSVRIISSGYPVTAPMVNGGFDPIAAFAGANDSISIEVFSGSEQIGPVLVLVPASRTPTVVRTNPPKGAHDVPLNLEIVIVFSQPIDSTTITSTSVQLTLNGSAVAVTRVVLANQPWVLRLTPKAFLTPSSTYTIAIDGTIKDATGLPLSAPVSADFITGTSVDSVASVAVYALGGGWGGGRLPSPLAVTTPGGSIQYTAYEVSTAGDTLSPGTSAPITWSTSDPSVATVNGAGLVAAVASGGATLNACTGTVCGQGQIIVDSVPVGVKPIQLGDLGGGASRVYGMAGGYATGFSKIAGSSCEHAFIWSSARGMEDLGTLPGLCDFDGGAVNSSAVVIGEADDSHINTGAFFIWKRATGMQLLPAPDAVHSWSPYAINNNGEILWASQSGDVFAFQSPTTGMHINATPAESTIVTGMNDLEQVVAYSVTAPAAVWILDGPSGHVLATISDGSGAMQSGSINNNGVVTGVANSDVNTTPFRWSAAQGFSYLPPLGPNIFAGPMFLNDAGDATVYRIYYRHIGADSLFESTSEIWLANGSVVALGGLGGTHTFANGINNSHQASGHSQVGSNTGPQQAVIWDFTSGASAQAAHANASTRKGQAAASPSVARGAAPRALPHPATAPRRPNLEY